MQMPKPKIVLALLGLSLSDDVDTDSHGKFYLLTSVDANAVVRQHFFEGRTASYTPQGQLYDDVLYKGNNLHSQKFDLRILFIHI